MSFQIDVTKMSERILLEHIAGGRATWEVIHEAQCRAARPDFNGGNWLDRVIGGFWLRPETVAIIDPDYDFDGHFCASAIRRDYGL